MGQRALLGLLGSLIFCSSAWAGQDLRQLQPLPRLSACTSTLHPQLPQQWRATYLMAPFTIGQLVLGEIVHDASLAATRITLHERFYDIRQRVSALAELVHEGRRRPGLAGAEREFATASVNVPHGRLSGRAGAGRRLAAQIVDTFHGWDS